ncbi:MAG: GAF domain-containing protein [Gaiellaceae bacterium]
MLFNAVPLLILAALYLAVGFAIAPVLWRERERMGEIGFAAALVFPFLGLTAAILGVGIAIQRDPLAGNALLSLPAIVLGAIPLVSIARNWGERDLLVAGVRRAREAEQRSTLRDRELASVGRLLHRLLDASEPDDVATLLLDELAEVFDLDLTNLALIEDEGRVAVLVAAREGGTDHTALLGQRIELDRESSGISAVVREGTAFAVYDAEQSAVVNQRLNAIAKVKSCVFVPVRARDEVFGVVFGAVRQPRLFEEDELALMQTLASEAGLALERSRATVALGQALERERLISRISLELRSSRNVDEVLSAVLEEIGSALDAVRCFVRVGAEGETDALLAEWDAAGIEPVGDAGRLPVVNLAARSGRTVAVADVLEAAELSDATLGDVRELAKRGVRAVLAAPIVAQDRSLGVLVFHRAVPEPWRPTEVALAEAVAREAAVALDTSRLLHDRERRLAEQQALLKAGEALTSDLRFDTVIERLVEELCALVNADAADCWTLAPSGSKLVCRAVRGLPEDEVGRTIAVEGTIGEAIETGRPVLRRDFATSERPAPSGNYAAFSEVMDAPIFSFGEIRGVLGACSREAGRFEESDLRLIEAFASLASIALRNAEAYEESTRQTQVERGFYRIAAVLSEPLSEQETLDAVAQAAAEALGGDSAAVLRSTGAELELVGSYEIAESLAAHLRETASGLAAYAHGGKVLASRRLREDRRFGDGLGEAAATAGRHSLLAVPLQQPGGERAGLVLVFFRGERTFEDDQLELARQVAAASLGALERSNLFERERRSRQLAQRLALAGRELAGELDPDDVFDQVARHAVELLDGDGASVRALEGDEVVVRAAAGAGETEALATRAPSTAWLVGDIVQTRATRAIADVGGDARVGEADAMLAAGYTGYLGVPMIGPEESVHGILAVYSLRPREWREEEAEALRALAATAVAARVNAELYQGISQEQQRGEAILANVADGIVAVDRDGKVVLWNPAAERVTGVSQAEALGRTPTDALGRPLDAADGTTGRSRMLPIRRGGEEVWLSLSEAVMTDPGGVVAGRIYAFRDISAERSVEQMKSDFVSTVSHELRTPLTSIFGFAETLLRQDVLFGEEERATFLRYIASESERLTSIVDRLLSVAQLDTGDIAVEITATDVGSVVNEAVRSAEGADGRNGHRFVVDLADEPLAAEADRDKLVQVLAHLLDNAVRYSPAGGTVTVSARRGKDAVEVSVEDEGVGIPHAEQERIFRKFYRGDAAAAGAVGAGATGLGLFLAEGLVTAMGGRIRVDSSEGTGSTFVLELRAAESER